MNESAVSLPLAQLLAHTARAVQSVRSGQSLTDVLGRVPAAARPGTQALAFAVLRRLGSALAVREALVPRQPSGLVDGVLLSALALLWPNEAPYAEHTLVDQAVAATRKLAPASAGFVNAVLRRFLRERANWVDRAGKTLEGAWNHPGWWAHQLQSDWPEHWQPLLRRAQERPPMALRVNARRRSVADYLQDLALAGLAGRTVAAPGCEQAVVLEQPCPVERLPGFEKGWVSVQDLAAQRAASLVLGPTGLPAGARVLDACAAPGGKTAHLLELADLDLLALDADAQRLERVSQTLKRLGLAGRCRVADARKVASWWDGHPFDAILLDAPCSASGIVRRHPDIRWLRRASDLPTLARTQAELLDALWPLLKPGGRLVYATCSVFKLEGQAQIDSFLQRQAPSSALLEPGSPGHLLPLTENSKGSDTADAAVDMDGFFYAALSKAAESSTY